MKRLLVLVVIMAVVGGVAVAAQRIMRGRQSPAAAVSTKVVYYCPMHPTYTADKPGSCPICNMTLVKREAGPAKDHPARAAEAICVMHNCPMAHDGRPCPMMVVAKAGEAVVCPVCGTHVAEAAGQSTDKKKILYWTDPMLPGYKSDKPGKSPMGMELVPVYEEPAAAGSGSASPPGYVPVRITPQQRQLIGVTTAVAGRRAMTKTIRAVGRIAYDPELYQAQQEYVQALRTLARARAEAAPEIVERSQQLVDAVRLRLRLLGLSPELIEEVGTQDGPDGSLLLTAPDGRAWLYAAIYEFELPWVKPGQTVTVTVPALPGTTFEGIVRAVDPVLDPVTRTARVRAVLTDPAGALKPEMYVDASLIVPIGDVLTVPDVAVFQTGTQQIVFVDQGEGRFDPRRVTVGVTAEGFSEILDGVSAGERVVTSGNFLIDSESRLKAALEGMTEGGHQHGGQ